MRLMPALAVTVTIPLCLNSVAAEDFVVRVSMHEKSAATFYVPGEIEGYGRVELMVDTGSGYMTINERTLDVLKRGGRVRYVKELRGILADGSELQVPVYSIERMSIGDSCWLHDVEAAVFPGKSRQILGLSALRRAAPFIFSVDPPTLALSRCDSLYTAEAEQSVRKVPPRAASR
jgi:predicted aspartyl protease